MLLATPALFAGPLLHHSVEALRTTSGMAIDDVALLSGPLLADFYASHAYQLAWNDARRLYDFLKLVESSRDDGFDPADFHIDRLRALAAPGALNALDGAARIAADLQLSDALLRYVHHTRFGKLDPDTVNDRHNHRAPVSAELLLRDMIGAMTAPDMREFLARRFPLPFWYRDLRHALARYRRFESFQDLQPLAGGAILGLGSRGPRVRQLRERLALFAPEQRETLLGAPEPERFDAPVREAVRAFQRRVGLREDGQVGPQTLATLNSPYNADMVERIRINLERMRWLYADLPAHYLFVDVADYRMYLVDEREVIWDTPVIVGATDAQTPMFRDQLDHIVFNPTWTVPRSIQKKMGRVSDNYLLIDRRTGRKRVGGNAADYKRYRVVQKPGPRNALGQVKFMFPNDYAIYLHDTPGRALFGRSKRALSHGCVRVKNPLTLAERLLQSSWSRKRIDQVVASSRTRYVNLTKRPPILLYYLTAYADAEGAVRLRKDIYQRDLPLREHFNRPVEGISVAFDAIPALGPDRPPGNSLVQNLPR